MDAVDLVLRMRSWRGSSPQETMLLLARAADMIERQRCTIGDYNADLTELQRRFNALKATVGAHRRAQYPTQPAEITQVDQQLYSAADVI